MLLPLVCSLLSNIAINSAGYSLVWADEFNYRGHPDRKKWDYEQGLVRNNEPQFYTKSRLENARVENGCLVLEARKEDFQGSKYTSASLITLGKFQFQYGRVDVRAQLPQGMGAWPAIWMLGADRTTIGWPRCAELDIMEHIAYEPNRIYGTLHQIAPDGNGHVSKGGTVDIDDPTKAFHIYSVVWSPKSIDILVDDKPFFTYPYKGPSTWTFDRPMYLLINLAIGGAWAGRHGIDDTSFPQKYLVDYVRVYQQR